MNAKKAKLMRKLAGYDPHEKRELKVKYTDIKIDREDFKSIKGLDLKENLNVENRTVRKFMGIINDSKNIYNIIKKRHKEEK